MQEKKLVVNDQLINYLTEDSEQAVDTVVFLHGWQASGEIWKPIFYRLKGKYNLCALDLPGFGKSEMPKTALGVGDYAGIVRDFIAKAGLKNIILVGHSFGGRVGIKLAAQGQELKKLILVDSAGFRDDSTLKTVKVGLAKMARPFIPEILRKPLRKLAGAEDYAGSGELKETFLKIIGEDLTADMQNVKIPTLLVWGEKDVDTPVEFGKKMNELMADSRLEIIPEAGHYSFLDKPDEFTKQLANFI